jgi:elongator complex protein 4
MTSSFRRAVPGAAPKASAEPAPAPRGSIASRLPRGTKLSTHNGQVLVSTGVSSLDDLFGGGLPLGSLLIVDEDRGTGYATLLLQYFISQGLQLSHGILVASADADPTLLVQQAPGPQEARAASSTAPRASADEDMKIAWRYRKLPKVGAAPAAAQGTEGSNRAILRRMCVSVGIHGRLTLGYLAGSVTGCRRGVLFGI